jgi:hypothetical protein
MTVTPKLSIAAEHTAEVRRSFLLLLGSAAVVAGLDLAHKAAEISERGGAVLADDRSAAYVVGVATAALVWAGLLVLTRSASLALAGGVILGACAGNLVSLALWPSVRGVPNPLVAGRLVFNLADAAVVLGLALLLSATVVFAMRNRERLSQPVTLRD